MVTRRRCRPHRAAPGRAPAAVAGARTAPNSSGCRVRRAPAAAGPAPRRHRRQWPAGAARPSGPHPTHPVPQGRRGAVPPRPRSAFISSRRAPQLRLGVCGAHAGRAANDFPAVRPSARPAWHRRCTNFSSSRYLRSLVSRIPPAHRAARASAGMRTPTALAQHPASPNPRRCFESGRQRPSRAKGRLPPIESRTDETVLPAELTAQPHDEITEWPSMHHLKWT